MTFSSSLQRIKTKIISTNPQRWWGDDFDVRFYLLSKISAIKKKSILDVGGGIGTISSEIQNDNVKINLDYSLDDLKTCGQQTDSNIQNICGSMIQLPFKNNSFDYIVCANLLEVAKKNDINKNQHSIVEQNYVYPTVIQTLQEIARVTVSGGTIFLTTPNNAYYKTDKLTFDELDYSLKQVFKNFKILFYNTHIKLGENRKLNLANLMPKIISKFKDHDKIIQSLVKESSETKYSVSFFVEIENN